MLRIYRFVTMYIPVICEIFAIVILPLMCFVLYYKLIQITLAYFCYCFQDPFAEGCLAPPVSAKRMHFTRVT